MDLTLSSIIVIIVVIAAIYLLIKFVINPIAKIITGILIVLLIIYVLKNYFSIDVASYITYGEWLNFDTWLNWIKSFLYSKFMV